MAEPLGKGFEPPLALEPGAGFAAEPSDQRNGRVSALFRGCLERPPPPRTDREKQLVVLTGGSRELGVIGK